MNGDNAAIKQEESGDRVGDAPENEVSERPVDRVEIKRIVRKLDTLPSVPVVATEILNILSREDPDLDKVIKLIETDQAITMKLLRLVNSAYFGFRNPVTSVSRAVALLGLSQLRSVLLSVTVSESLLKPLKKRSTKDQDALWKHSLGCAVWSELIAEAVDAQLKTEAFVGGLLHDVGKLILEECFPGKYELVVKRCEAEHEPWFIAEKEILGIDHTTVGKWLAAKWNLPRNLIQAIWLHHQPLSALLDLEFVVNKKLIATVYLSNILAHELMVDSLSVVQEAPEISDVLEFLGISTEQLEELKVKVGKRYSERTTVLDIKSQDEISFYYEALQRANRKLAEMASKGAEYAALAKVNHDLRLLHGLNLELARADDSEDVLDRVVDVLCSDFNEEEGAIYYLSKSEKKLLGRYWSSGRKPAAIYADLDEDMSPVQTQIDGLNDQINNLVNTCHARFMEIADDSDRLTRLQYCKPYLIIPMVKESCLLGEIYLLKEGSDPAELLTPSTLEMYKYLASIAATSLWKIELVTETEETAESLIRALSKNGELLQRLTRSVKQYEDLFENSNDAIILHRPDGNIVKANRKTAELLGYSEAELKDRSIKLIFPDDISDEVFERLKEKWSDIRGGRIETVVRHSDDRVLEVEISTKLVDPAGSIIQSIIRDISHIKEATRALEEEKERLSVMLKSIGEGVIATDSSGKVVLVNEVAENLLGMKEDEIAGRPLEEIFRVVCNGSTNPCADLCKAIFDDKKTWSTPPDSILVRPDGKERIIHATGAPIFSGNREILGSIVVFRDITENKKIEKELLKAQKLESIGILAGGIAHDFNNSLTAILGNISLAKIYAKPGDTIYRVLTEAERASMQARDLTQQLLTFSMGGAPIKKPTSVEGIIKQSADFCLRGTNVRCESDIAEDLWAIDADETQISQVIQNLVINAGQAMPEGGVIKISADNISVTDSRDLPLEPGKYVKITIRDRGKGIPEDYLERIFEPYFTTKEKGYGLGLATSYSIVKKHGGHISVDSKVGEGTTFCVYLPATEKRVEEKRDEKEPVPGTGRILVMDDDGDVRAVLSMMLDELGYEVHLVQDGEQALKVYMEEKESGRPFDLVIMDLTIQGGIGGEQAIRRLLDLDPSARAIVSSGYYNDPVMADFRKYGFMGVITKPYNIEELSVVIKKALAGVK